MAFYIQDDIWEAICCLPDSEKGELLLAWTKLYHGEETEEFSSIYVQSLFLSNASRVTGQAAKAKAGKAGGKAKAKSKQTSSKTLANAKQNASKALAESKQNPSRTLAESKQTSSKTLADSLANEKQKASIPSYSLSYSNSINTSEEELQEDRSLAFLAILNEELGTTYSHLPPSVGAYLAGVEASESDVRRMIRFKRDEWKGTRFERNLTPNTLFSAEHFQQYMEQSKQGGGESLEKYDRFG